MTVRRGVIVLVLGLLLIGGAIVVGFTQFAGMDPTDELTVPGVHEVELGAGGWVVYERVELLEFGGLLEEDGLERLFEEAFVRAVTEVEVLDVAGNVLEVRAPGVLQQSLEVDGVNYSGVAVFSLPSTGTYTIDVAASEPTQIRVGPDPGGSITPLIVTLLLALAGSFLVVVGIIVTAVAWSRRALSLIHI